MFAFDLFSLKRGTILGVQKTDKINKMSERLLVAWSCIKLTFHRFRAHESSPFSQKERTRERP